MGEDFISSKSEIEHVQAERLREKWENENHPEGEKEEMIQLYKARGLSEEDAQQVGDTLPPQQRQQGSQPRRESLTQYSKAVRLMMSCIACVPCISGR